jgi:hypothetical protein
MKSRRSLLALIVLAAIFVGAGLAAYITTRPPQGAGIPWHLTGMGGVNSNVGQHHPFDTAQAATMTSLEVHVEMWPVSEAPADTWLDQTVDYGSDSVTITLRLHHTGSTPGLLSASGYFDTGGWVTVALREPLRSRNLVDGATGKVVPYPPAP